MDDIETAFKAIPRVKFLPPDVAIDAAQNYAIPIGFGQTNSQPETVELMLRWLEVEPGQNILDVGSGSGLTTGLLAHLIGRSGHVTAVEIIPELVEFGRDNCARLGIINATFHAAGRIIGWPKHAPYDRILVSASGDTIPDALVRQLKPNGRMVIPVRESIIIMDKDEQGNTTWLEQPGFVFVPLISTN